MTLSFDFGILGQKTWCTYDYIILKFSLLNFIIADKDVLIYKLFSRAAPGIVEDLGNVADLGNEVALEIGAVQEIVVVPGIEADLEIEAVRENVEVSQRVLRF